MRIARIWKTSGLGALAMALGCILPSGALSDEVATDPAAVEKTAPQVTSLAVHPTELSLAGPFAYGQLLVSGTTATAQTIDATRMAVIECAPEGLVTISDRGQVRAAQDGEGTLTIRVGDATAEVPIRVGGQEAPYEVSFVQDVMPAMAKMGCNAGTCHGAQAGKNGFKLSLRGYDPEFDYAALTDELAGRRFNRAAPERSLMLLKPAGGVPHVGGVRTRPGEPYYEILRRWIASGVTLDLERPRVESITLAPENPVVSLPGDAQQFAVVATFSDGTTRDVTAESFLETSLAEVVEVDDAGLATAVRRGEAAVLARYEGAYASTRVIVMGDRTGFTWRQPPTYHYVDELVYGKLEQMMIEPGELCTDAAFLRRVYLDLTGLPPTPDDVRAFLADSRPTREKREEMIDRLVGSDVYVEHWTNKWSDLLQVNRKFLTEKGAWALRNWIRDAIARNMPYDEFAHTVLTASGSTYDNPPAAYMRVLREPAVAMENSTQLFLGVRFSCNKCHDHPFERWTQNQYYDLAAYFAQVGRKQGTTVGEEVIFDTRGQGEVKHERTGAVVAPAFPYEHDDVAAEDASRRAQFAHWATSPENQYFAKSFVNRMWAYLLGVGLIDPIDDIRAGNPPSNPELLERLTAEFVENGFDIQALVRRICSSRTYQHTVATTAWNEDDSTNYSHALARRLPAEVLYDCVHRVTGADPKIPGLPTGSRAAELVDSSVKLPGGFLDLFGKPPRESSCECERVGGVMLSQALTMVNGPTIAEAIAASGNAVGRLVEEEEENTKVVEELFLSILCRPPTDTEIAAGTAAIQAGESRLAGAEDLAWALINSPAFLFNH